MRNFDLIIYTHRIFILSVRWNAYLLRSPNLW